jgi:hypothetical protein
VEEAQNYLKDKNIGITQVVNNSLTGIGVAATPTLMIVNEKGVVSEYWRGKLSSDREKEVLAKLAA